MRYTFYVDLECNDTVDYSVLARELEVIVRRALEFDYDQKFFDHTTVHVSRKRARFVRTAPPNPEN